MAMSKELLEILACPETKQPLTFAAPTLLERLNNRIRQGQLTNRRGTSVTALLTVVWCVKMGSISIPFGMIFPLCLSTKPFHSPGKRDLYHCPSSSYKDLCGKTPGKHDLRQYKIASNANHNIRQRGATRQAVDDTIRQPWDAEPQLNKGAEAVFITKCLTMCETIAPQTVGRERTAAQCTMRCGGGASCSAR